MRHKVAALQMTTGLDLNQNLHTAKKWIAAAAREEAEVIVLPEMFATMGMDQMDKMNHAETLGHGVLQDFLAEQAFSNQIWLVGGTLPLKTCESGKVHAACLVFNEKGQRVGHYNKIHLFDVSLNENTEQYKESQAILPGKTIEVIATPAGKMGLAVCYDLRFPELFRAMQETNVEWVALPAAFTQTTGKVHWEVLVRARAIENQIYMVAAAQSGLHANGRNTYGHSMIVDPWGQVKSCLPHGEGMVISEIDHAFLAKVRKEFPVLTHRSL